MKANVLNATSPIAKDALETTSVKSVREMESTIDYSMIDAFQSVLTNARLVLPHTPVLNALTDIPYSTRNVSLAKSTNARPAMTMISVATVKMVMS